MSDAIANILSTCIYRTQWQVAFALQRKLLLKITNVSAVPATSENFESNW